MGTIVPRLSRAHLCWEQQSLDLPTATVMDLHFSRALCLAVVPVPTVLSWPSFPKRLTHPSMHLWSR